MFEDKDNEILIQIMEHGTSEAAHRKILKKEMTLSEMIKFIQAEEQSELEARKIENKDAKEVNLARRATHRPKPKTGYAQTSSNQRTAVSYEGNSSCAHYRERRSPSGKQGSCINSQHGADGTRQQKQKGNSALGPKQTSLKGL